MRSLLKTLARTLPRRPILLALGAAAFSCCAAWLLSVSPGCKAIESTADSLADATAGSAFSGVFRSAARAAEGFRDYSPAEEYYIGRAVAVQILTKYKVHPDQELQDYVNLVGLAVLAAPEAKTTLKGYRFVVVEGEDVQAVSAPAGFVFLTEGTVRKAKDEDELAAVLAHEVAHVSLKHGIGAIQAATRQKSLAILAQTGGEIVGEYKSKGDPLSEQLAELTVVFGDAIKDITDELLVKGYSRDTEVEADKQAAVYLRSSGYARAALVSFLKTLEAIGQAGAGGWGKTHPAAKERIDELAEADLATGSAVGRDVRSVRFRQSMSQG